MRAHGSAPQHDGIPPPSTPSPLISDSFAAHRESPLPQQGSSRLTQDSRGSGLPSTTLGASLPSPGPTPTSAAPLTSGAFLHPPPKVERPQSAASGYRSHLSAATAPPQQPGLVFDHKRTNLTILEFSSNWCRAAHAVGLPSSLAYAKPRLSPSFWPHLDRSSGPSSALVTSSRSSFWILMPSTPW